MKNGYITFRSVTVAQRGEGVLQRAGIDCSLQRTPRWMEERGCGYCLRLRQEEMKRGVEALRKNSVPISRAYKRKEDGTMEVVDL